jgi:hypothetical protein
LGRANKPLTYEFGDVVLWVAFGGEKPFPICIYAKDGQLLHKVHPHRNLSNHEHASIARFIEQRSNELSALWPDAFTTKLRWPTPSRKGIEEDG